MLPAVGPSQRIVVTGTSGHNPLYELRSFYVETKDLRQTDGQTTAFLTSILYFLICIVPPRMARNGAYLEDGRNPERLASTRAQLNGTVLLHYAWRSSRGHIVDGTTCIALAHEEVARPKIQEEDVGVAACLGSRKVEKSLHWYYLQPPVLPALVIR